MMRYVGAIAGAALIAALLGSDPDEGGFRILVAVFAGVAVLNLVVSLEIRDRPGVGEEGEGREDETSSSTTPREVEGRGA